MTEVLKIIQNETLTYHQKVKALADLAENSDAITLPRSKEFLEAKSQGFVCDLNEGLVPYRPRYIVPDYRILFEKGSKTLNITPPQDLWEACASLQIMYHNVPSSSGYPVFLGNFDELLEPFVLKMSEKEAKQCLRLFLLHIDKTLPDSFIHATFGPKSSVTGKLLMELSAEMQLAVPNLSLKYDPEVTPDDFAELAVKTMLEVAKPSFVNHKMLVAEWGEDYAVASCFNCLRIGGGGLTLHRLRLGTIGEVATDKEDFFTNHLPKAVDIVLNIMEERVRFIIEESRFFETSFLVLEGFIQQERFVGMFGLVGLAECVNHLLKIDNPEKGFGWNEEADELGETIIQAINKQVSEFDSKYCASTNHHFGLHAQVGIETDTDNSPGTRIPIGHEPLLHQQLNHSCRYHKYFVTGTGDVFTFDSTWKESASALVDILKGAMSQDYRYFSGYSADSDVVRVTGYLVKRSELEKIDNNKASLNGSTILAKGQRDAGKAFERRIHGQGSHK